MNRDEIARIYEKANGWSPAEYPTTMTDLERFADLFAKHTLANIDPSSFMSWQEGYAAGAAAEREACAQTCETIGMKYQTLRYDLEWQTKECAAAIRARGQT